MSHGYFESYGQSAFAIHEDETENALSAMPGKAVRDETQSRGLQVKRTALGTIASNTTRVQPFRAVKQGQGHIGFENKPQENITSSKLGLRPDAENRVPLVNKIQAPQSVITTQPFSIFCDEDVSQKCNKPLIAVPSKITSSLHSACNLPAATSLASEISKLRQPLATLTANSIDVDEESNQSFESGSPMVLSNSISSSAHGRGFVSRWPNQLQMLLSASEYSDDIYTYLRQLERYQCPKADYMTRQTDINNNMRCILVDWLVEVAEEYKLHRETLCLSVNYIDRFLSHMAVMRQKLQLLGTASMFLASKFEEIYPPEVGEFVYITDDTYTKKQVLRMEHLVLKVLEFDIATPTANCFCERFLAKLNADETTASLAMYLVELSLLEADPFLRYLPSQVAASAVILANFSLAHEPWPNFMAQSSGYDVKDLKPCVRDLFVALCRAPTHPQQAIREKYKQAKYCQVALLSPPTSLPL